MPAAALDGIRILEWSHRMTDQFTAKLIADLGADVIKIEPPAGGPARRYGPFPQDEPHPERSGLFLNANTNKRGITLKIASATSKTPPSQSRPAPDLGAHNAYVLGELLGYSEMEQEKLAADGVLS